MALKEKPKLLKKVSDGRIFNYTDKLAARVDMVPVWENGIDPYYEKPKGLGLAAGESDIDTARAVNEDVVEEGRTSQLRSALNEKNQQILSLQEQLNETSDECMRLNAEVARLTKLLTVDAGRKAQEEAQANAKETFGTEEPDAGDVVEQFPDDPARQAQIKAAVANLLEERNPLSFTGRGLLRLPVLGEVCGFPVSAAERDDAVELITKENK